MHCPPNTLILIFLTPDYQTIKQNRRPRGTYCATFFFTAFCILLRTTFFSLWFIFHELHSIHCCTSLFLYQCPHLHLYASVCTPLYQPVQIQFFTLCTCTCTPAAVSAKASLPIKAKAAIGERHETWDEGSVEEIFRTLTKHFLVQWHHYAWLYHDVTSLWCEYERYKTWEAPIRRRSPGSVQFFSQ